MRRLPDATVRRGMHTVRGVLAEVGEVPTVWALIVVLGARDDGTRGSTRGRCSREGVHTHDGSTALGGWWVCARRGDSNLVAEPVIDSCRDPGSMPGSRWLATGRFSHVLMCRPSMWSHRTRSAARAEAAGHAKGMRVQTAVRRRAEREEANGRRVRVRYTGRVDYSYSHETSRSPSPTVLE